MIQSWQTVLYRINAGILYRLFLLIEQQLFLTRCFPGSSFLHWLNSWLFRRCFPEWSFFAEWTAWWFRHPTFTWLTSRRLFAATFWNFGHTGDRTPDPLCRKPCALVHFATRLLSRARFCIRYFLFYGISEVMEYTHRQPQVNGFCQILFPWPTKPYWRHMPKNQT